MSGNPEDSPTIGDVGDESTRSSKRARLSNTHEPESSNSPGEFKPRRSSRLCEKPRMTIIAPVTRPRKRRAPAKPKRPSAGIGFMHMPVEIIVEIVGYLNPTDLLNMARSSQSLRNLFMSKDSKSAWRRVRENLELPDCPDDLSEPQYADLLFGKGCYECGITQTNKLYFSLRLRLCKECTKERLMTASRAQEIAAKLVIKYSDAGIRLSPIMWSIDYRTGLYLGRRAYIPTEVLYDGAVVKKNKKAYKSLLVAEDYDGLQKLMEEHDKYNAEVMEATEQIERWRLDQAAKKEADRKRIVEERKTFITNKLRGFGYTCSDFMSYREDYKRWKSLVCANRPITDKGFARIRPELEQLIAQRREARAQDNVSIPPCPCARCQGIDNTDNHENRFMFIVHLAATYFSSFGNEEAEGEEMDEDDLNDLNDLLDEEEQEDFFRNLFTQVVNHYGIGV